MTSTITIISPLWLNFYLCTENCTQVDPLVGAQMVENITKKDVGCIERLLRRHRLKGFKCWWAAMDKAMGCYAYLDIRRRRWVS